jgi:hypothetical protein
MPSLVVCARKRSLLNRPRLHPSVVAYPETGDHLAVLDVRKPQTFIERPSWLVLTTGGDDGSRKARHGLLHEPLTYPVTVPFRVYDQPVNIGLPEFGTETERASDPSAGVAVEDPEKVGRPEVGFRFVESRNAVVSDKRSLDEIGGSLNTQERGDVRVCQW